MLLAELEVWHSRSIAPTRRVALGRSDLPVSPAPGFGGLLLGGIVAVSAPELDDELRGELLGLLAELESGRRIVQPRLRHRFQADRHGLARTSHRLLGEGDALALESKGEGSGASQALAAAYAAGGLPVAARRPVMAVLRRGLRWRGGDGPALFAHLSTTGPALSWSAAAFADPTRWALDVLGLDDAPIRKEVQRAFRVLLRDAHPDHG
ncbi:MAG: hypothetical protein AB7O29_09415, partial [Acidimicrobiia bacterium]